MAIFFVISGFLLYRPFVRARLRGERAPRPLAYAWRRALRIAPNYWVALTVTTIVLGTAGVFTLSDGPLYYGFAQTWREDTIGGGLAQAWTLCIEVTFYAFLPLFAWAMRRAPGARLRRPDAHRARGAGAAVRGQRRSTRCVLLAGGDQEQIVITPSLVSLPGFLDQFAIGMALAVLTVWLERRDSLPRPLARDRPLPGAALARRGGGVLGGEHADRTDRAAARGLHARRVPLAPPAVRADRARRGAARPSVGDSSRGIVRRVLANPRAPLARPDLLQHLPVRAGRARPAPAVGVPGAGRDAPVRRAAGRGRRAHGRGLGAELLPRRAARAVAQAARAARRDPRAARRSPSPRPPPPQACARGRRCSG